MFKPTGVVAAADDERLILAIIPKQFLKTIARNGLARTCRRDAMTPEGLSCPTRKEQPVRCL